MSNKHGFDIQAMFKGVSDAWIELFTSKTMMPLLSRTLGEIWVDEKDITPPPNQIFNFARETPLNDIKVVILGQDPYPKKGDAHGLAFSSTSDKIPASLRNIYKCLLKQGEISEMPETANLRGWANQGVLLLNSSLTTKVGLAGAHMKSWTAFTDELIRIISNGGLDGSLQLPIFMLWGSFAHKKENLIDSDCIIYKWLHPSPLAQGSADDTNKFMNCSNFADVNTALVNDIEVSPINWDPSPHHIIYTDGACSNNGKGVFSNAGYAAYFAKGPLEGTVKYGKVPPVALGGEMVYGTNNRGEGLGIIYALEGVIEKKVKSRAVVVTDSMFWKDMIEKYMPGWEGKGIDFKDRKNYDITTRLHAAAKAVCAMGGLEIIHVASHDKDPSASPVHIKGNRIADEYACKGKLLDDFVGIVENI